MLKSSKKTSCTEIALASIIFVTLLVGGCTSTRLSEEERFQAYENFKSEQSLEQVDKITNVSYSRWTPLGEQHLILYRGANRPFLVTLKNRCFDLDNALSIKINAFGSSLAAGSDSISTLEKYSIRCFIDQIHKLTPEHKKTLVKLGRREDADKPIAQYEEAGQSSSK